MAILAGMCGVVAVAQTPPPAANEQSPAPKVPLSTFEAIQSPPPLTPPSDTPTLKLQLDDQLTAPPPLSPNADSDDTPQPPPPRKRADQEPD